MLLSPLPGRRKKKAKPSPELLAAEASGFMNLHSAGGD